MSSGKTVLVRMECAERVKVDEIIYLSSKSPEGKECHKKIDSLMNEEGHEINDDSKMAELLNSFLKSAFNKRNEARKHRQLGPNEDTTKIAPANMKVREFLT